MEQAPAGDAPAPPHLPTDAAEIPRRSPGGGREADSEASAIAARLRRGLGQRFRLEGELGEGGMAIVFRARDLRHGRDVAIKVLRPELARSLGRKRFLREIRTTARLVHPHILPLHDSGVADGLLYYVMPYIPGESLASRLGRERRVPPAEALRIGAEVADALAHAHERGIVHRDIKPGNVLLAGGGHVYVADFGLARAVQSASNHRMTAIGALIGTLVYTSPEQIQGEDDADGRGDVYSLGCALFEALAGQPPFGGEGLTALVKQHMLDAPPALCALCPELPRSLERILAATLAKDPRERPDAARLRALLLAWSDTAGAEPPGEGGEAGRRRPAPEGRDIASPSSARVSVSTILPAELLPSGERRALTLVCCEVAEPAGLFTETDPELLRVLLREMKQRAREIVRRLDGSGPSFAGERLLAYFGLRQAHEDDPVRAIRAAQELVRATEQLRTHGPEPRLRVRIGVHSGLVVLGEPGPDDPLEEMAEAGPTQAVATMLAGRASPDSVVISAATRQLVEGRFEFRERGSDSAATGAAARAYEVVAERSPVSETGDVASGKLSPLLGREREMRALRELWDQARSGARQAVLLSGDAGIGKSRLVRALRDEIAAGSEAEVVEGRCSPYYQSTALYPVVEILERILCLDVQDATTTRLAKLETFLEATGFDVARAVPLLAPLLAIAPLDGYAPPQLTPERQRQKTAELLVAMLLECAARRPLLLVVEDLHWADPSTLALLHAVVEGSANVPLLALLTCRLPTPYAWERPAGLAELPIERLGRDSSRLLVGALVEGRSLPSSVIEGILERTDGVPLFLEELTRSVLETAAPQLAGEEATAPSGSSLEIPATLQASLLARLDRLGEDKAVAQLCATFGREFEYEVMRAVSAGDEDALQAGLARLVDAGLLYVRGMAPRARYRFKHTLLQEAARGSLTGEDSRRLHGQIARRLEAALGSAAAIQPRPELLAYHYAEAGLAGPAIAWWLAAARLALQRSANLEAAASVQRALALLPGVADESARGRHEVVLLSTLGPALIAMRGFGDADVGRIYGRARLLCESMKEDPQIFPVLWGLWVFYLVRGELETSRGFARDMLRLAEATGDSAHLVEAYWTLGDSEFWLGELGAAREHLERAMALYDPERHGVHAYVFGQDPGVAARCYLGYTLRYLGDSAGMRRVTDEALALATQLGHPFTIGWARGCWIMGRLWEDEDPALVLAESERAIAFCMEQAYPFWLTGALFSRGWALARLGRTEEGIAEMRRGIAGWAATGSEVVQPNFMALLAAEIGAAGQVGEALAVLEDAFERARRSGEKVSEIDLHRVQADLLLRANPPDPLRAEASYRRAIELARACTAAAPEQRAARELCALLEGQGRIDEAARLRAELTSRLLECQAVAPGTPAPGRRPTF